MSPLDAGKLQHTTGFTVSKMMKNLLAPLSLVTCGHLSVVMLPLIITHRNSNAVQHTHSHHRPPSPHHHITLETGPRLTTTHTLPTPLQLPTKHNRTRLVSVEGPLNMSTTLTHLIQLLGARAKGVGATGSVCGQLGSSSDDVMARCEGWTGAANRIWVAPIHT